MELEYKALIMDEASFDRTVTRIAHQILEKNNGAENLCLIGIKTRGIPLACRLAGKIKMIDGTAVPVGKLDISLYRDDLSVISDDAICNDTEIGFNIVDKTVILVDDVIYTGRTARAALEAVMNIGRPSKIQLFAMIDRGHAELPIKANFVGKNIPTSLNEVVSVKLSEIDGETKICILKKCLNQM